ncbi:MAG: hypothetical protein ACFB4I_19305 [Cyanophyceae cyanobacterium]
MISTVEKRVEQSLTREMKSIKINTSEDLAASFKLFINEEKISEAVAVEHNGEVVGVYYPKRCLDMKCLETVTQKASVEAETTEDEFADVEERETQVLALSSNNEPISFLEATQEFAGCLDRGPKDLSVRKLENDRLFAKLDQILDRMAAQSGMTRDELADALDPSKPFPFEQDD